MKVLTCLWTADTAVTPVICVQLSSVISKMHHKSGFYRDFYLCKLQDLESFQRLCPLGPHQGSVLQLLGGPYNAPRLPAVSVRENLTLGSFSRSNFTHPLPFQDKFCCPLPYLPAIPHEKKLAGLVTQGCEARYLAYFFTKNKEPKRKPTKKEAKYLAYCFTKSKEPKRKPTEKKAKYLAYLFTKSKEPKRKPAEKEAKYLAYFFKKSKEPKRKPTEKEANYFAYCFTKSKEPKRKATEKKAKYLAYIFTESKELKRKPTEKEAKYLDYFFTKSKEPKRKWSTWLPFQLPSFSVPYSLWNSKPSTWLPFRFLTLCWKVSQVFGFLFGFLLFVKTFLLFVKT